MASSVPRPALASVSFFASVPVVAIASIRPAWAISVSAETLSASEMALSTRTDGWCRPRSTWLRYGLDRLVSSASWRSDRLARLRCSRMKAPSTSRCASHMSVTAPPLLTLTIVRGSAGVPALPRTCSRVPAARDGGSFAVFGALVFGAGHQRGRRLEDLLGELALAGEQLLGEVVRAGHELLRLGQLVRARHLHRGDLRGDGLDGLDPGPDRVDHGVLALADRAQELVLQVLRGGACHFLPPCGLYC